MNTYTPAAYKRSAFNCPNCGAYASQEWFGLSLKPVAPYTVEDLDYCTCSHCGTYSLWRKGTMIFPSVGNAPFANTDLPMELKKNYEEARDIATRSPRAAAAMLRQIIKDLCDHLGEKGHTLNEAINNLVKKGLPQKIKVSLRWLRVIGRNASPPGHLNAKDDAIIAEKLFTMVNLITAIMISQPRDIEDLVDVSAQDKAINENT